MGPLWNFFSFLLECFSSFDFFFFQTMGHKTFVPHYLGRPTEKVLRSEKLKESWKSNIFYLSGPHHWPVAGLDERSGFFFVFVSFCMQASAHLNQWFHLNTKSQPHVIHPPEWFRSFLWHGHVGNIQNIKEHLANQRTVSVGLKSWVSLSREHIKYLKNSQNLVRNIWKPKPLNSEL